MTFRRYDRDDGRVAFEFGSLEDDDFKDIEFEIGEVVLAAGEGTEHANSAQLYRAKFRRTGGSEGDGIAGFSVPAEIADRVAEELVSRGHTVE